MSEIKKKLYQISIRDKPSLIIAITFIILRTATCDTCPNARTFKMLPVNNAMFTQDVLFEVSSMSSIDCGRICVGTEGCVMFTFQGSQNGAPDRCRVYGQVHNLTDPQENSPGARSYAVNIPAPRPCPSGYNLSCCRCLRYMDERRNYTEAIERCQEMDQGQLVMTKTVAEIECVEDFLKQILGDALEYVWVWVGADDMDKDGQFAWRDGTHLPNDSSLWEPHHYKQPGLDCVDMGYYSFTDKLYSYRCDYNQNFICQKNL